MRNVVIIGSGIGGLVTGYLLSRHGDHVTIFEQNEKLGGAMQSFYRDGIRFDTGFHFVGGLEESNPMYYFFNQLGLLNLPWISVPEYQVCIGNQSYRLSLGYEAFANSLMEYFPADVDNIRHYIASIQQIATAPISNTLSYWQQSAWNFMASSIVNPELRDVLSGASQLLVLDKERLPLYEFADIMHSMICSTSRLADGPQSIVNHLQNGILQSGGQIYCGKRVSSILEYNRRVVGVLLNDGDQVNADVIVSAIHPIDTMNLLDANTSMRSIYRNRVAQLTNSAGCFTVNVKLKPDSVPLSWGPTYVHRRGCDMWNPSDDSINHIMLHYYPSQNALDILTPMSWNMVSPYMDSSSLSNVEEYQLFKQYIVDKCLDLAKLAVPDICQSVAKYWSSSPLTWSRYLSANHGTAFGVMKDYHNIEYSLLPPRTPLNGLYLTGQSLMIHGVMGTTISAFRTAATINHDIAYWPEKYFE